MTLKTRVMPVMLWKGVGLVKGESFNSWRRIGTVMPAKLSIDLGYVERQSLLLDLQILWATARSLVRRW